MKKISIVVPCYNEEACIETFYYYATNFLNSISYDYEIIFVNDGSVDLTAELGQKLATVNNKVKLINLSKNFGQESAILAGLEHAKGDCAVVMDCDLQDPVELIAEMLAKWEKGYKIVHTKRSQQKGVSWFKKITSKLYSFIFNLLSETKTKLIEGDFKLYDRQVLDEILKLPEKQKFFRGLTGFVGFKQTCVSFNRPKRKAGKTKYNLSKMINLGVDGVVSNSNKPLMLPFYFGSVLSAIAGIVFTVFTTLLMFKIYLPLTAWLFPTIIMLFSFVFIFMGIHNFYLGKIYNQTKNRPDYIIESKINFDND